MASWQELLTTLEEDREKLRADLVSAAKKSPNQLVNADGRPLNNIELHGVFNDQAFLVTLSKLRQKYIKEFAEIRGRNIICYYSGWQAKDASIAARATIRDSDRDGFMGAVHAIDRSKGLDLLLHTPGGDIAATATICSYLGEMFSGNIEVFIPHTCMSAGTMIAFCARKLYMGKQSVIGPIDPQLHGMPASGIIQELERAKEDMTTDSNSENLWKYLLSRYQLGLVSECQRTFEWSKRLAKDLLIKGLLRDDDDPGTIADSIIEKFTSYQDTMNHSRQINYQEATNYGLHITLLEENQAIQDAVLAIHHLYAHTFNNTDMYKIISNNNGHEYIQSSTS